ncbi:uncharacterized protein LOC124648694 [Lolium rigidum]|uniref:uncharacterized protein LOC124648694 n=1 Tax=Lolium rigidum TaxID=89674 RepID=UPI001F5C0DD3|nr:uncharacterized protein LOC124648694 [Lolium rigidum]
MPLLLRRLAGAVSAPLRRSLCTAASRPPWAMVYSWAALDASPAARATFDLDAAPYISQISVPAHLADGMDFAAASVRATSSDGLLLLDLAEARHGPLPPPHVPDFVDTETLHQMAAAGAAAELDVTRFVCNPLSGQLFRLPVAPDLGAAKASTAFGLLTQPDGAHGPPDRFVVAQLCFRARDNRPVVRRFLSETGEWDDQLPMPCSVPPRMPSCSWQQFQVHTSHDVLAFGDRLWWFDAAWGAVSVDPFSDRPGIRFVELPRGSERLDIDIKDKMLLTKRRIMGVSEGKLRYIETSTEKEPFMIRSFALDDEGRCWKLTRESTITMVLPNKAKPHAGHLPWIAAIDPFDANVLYFNLVHTVFAMDMAKKKAIRSRPCPERLRALGKCHSCAFYLPCVLPTWLQSCYIPSAEMRSGLPV